MQRLTFELIGVRTPTTEADSETVRTRMSDIGFIDPSIILKTDNTVNVLRDKNIYTISSNLTIESEFNTVSSSSTITLKKDNYGTQEVLINVETSDAPGYAEIIDYTTTGNVITLNTHDYDNKDAFIKYLTSK